MSLHSAADRGSAGVWVLALSGVLMLAGAASVLTGVAIVTRHEAGAAADLAALAAASQALSGSAAACEVADAIARANGARLEKCHLDADGVVDVTTTVTIRLSSLGLGVARAQARAGPAEIGVARGSGNTQVGTASAARASSIESRIVTAAPLSSGELPLPHLGD